MARFWVSVFAIMVFVISATAWSGSIYQCNRNGKMILTDRPCRQGETVTATHSNRLSQLMDAYQSKPCDETRRALIKEAQNTSCDQMVGDEKRLLSLLNNHLPSITETYLKNCIEMRTQQEAEKQASIAAQYKQAIANEKQRKADKVKDDMRIFLGNERLKSEMCWNNSNWRDCLSASQQRVRKYCNDFTLSNDDKISCLRYAGNPYLMDYERK